MSNGSSRVVETRLRAVVESSPSGLLMIDATGIIVLVNREVERLFGYSREELLGEPVEKLVPRAFREAHQVSRAAFVADPRTRAMGAGRELSGLRSDGVEIPVEIGLTPVVTQEGLFIISSIVDISARRSAEGERSRLENELRQAQKLEALGRLAGGVAHDFNNILSTIVGFAELARDAAASNETREDLDEILRATNRGRDLVERILRFSRRQALQLQPLDLTRTVADAVRLLRPTLPAAIELRLTADEEPRRILGDATSVQQIVVNLVTNSAQALPRGGKVEVGLEDFYVRDHFAREHPGLREGRYALLKVRDEGCGMDPETLSRAFEPFFTTKPAGEGSGLGLATVHGIVRDHGGMIWLDSEPGQGTRVTCILPALEDPALDEAPRPEVIVRGRGERVLLIDDEPQLVEIGSRRLERLGYQVLAVASPEAALAALRNAPRSFDLVVTDYSMPGMSGLELAIAASRIRPGLPVVMASGYVDEFSPEQLAAAGIRVVLAKPVHLVELAAALRRALDAN